MDSPSFYTLVKNFTSLTGDEYGEINDLSRKYPYCQLINLLNARVAQDLHLANKDQLLHYAAVYSTERAVLKQLMTAPKVERIVALPVPEIAEETNSAPEPDILLQESKEDEDEQLDDDAPIPEREPVSLSNDDLITDIYAELDKLKRLKKEFAKSVEEFEKVASTSPKNTAEKESVNEPLIEEIKTTKKKLKIENPKQKEQNEIIDKFIKTQPSLPKAKPTEPASDLSEDSGMFGDNIVSETLVEILLKQGKKDKAIEVLKKLIWKFPQKKAYFAAQIDSLKN